MAENVSVQATTYEAIQKQIDEIAAKELAFEDKISEMTQIADGTCQETALSISSFIFRKLTSDEPEVSLGDVERLRGEAYRNANSWKRDAYIGKKATHYALSAYNALAGGTRGYHYSFADLRQYTFALTRSRHTN